MRSLKAYLVGFALGLSPAILGAQVPQYGYIPPYATADLPTCSAGWVNRPVFDTTARELRVCDGDSWEPTYSSSGGGLPAGGIMFILSGSCPTGYAEETSLAAKFLVATTVAAGDVGTGAGSDTITAVLNHTHPVTDPGHGHTQNSHNHTQDAHNHTQNSFAPRIINSGTAGTVGVQGASAASNANASNSATTATNQAATATNQAATATNQTNTTGVTTANPVGGVASLDNRPAFLRLIPCRKT